MKTKEVSEKEKAVVYRKDGVTPDRRYKSSRNFTVTPDPEISVEPTKEAKAPEFLSKRFRDNVTSKQTGKNELTPVQIKPVGKKPLWKVSR